MRTSRDLEIVAGKVEANGTAQIGEGFTVRKTGTGQYVVTLDENFRILAVTFAPHVGGTGIYGANVTPGEHIFQISAFVSNTLAATDTMFSFIAVGYRQ